MLGQGFFPKTQILALDVGQRRIGVARTYADLKLAQPLQIVQAGDGREYRVLQALIDDYQPTLIVIGLPLNLRGQETAQTQFVRTWVQHFKDRVTFQGRLVWQDETLSSQAAAARQPRSKVGQPLDDQAACVILEDYLQGVD